jgi:diadenosine tetraphosphate (Ap4A) HIT family hydrolase
MSNLTAAKFGHPRTLVAETEHWLVLVRPAQLTLGSLVLVCKEEVKALAEVSAEAFAGLKPVTARLEPMLKSFVDYERINYTALMMVDPDVHFHVFPRYS